MVASVGRSIMRNRILRCSTSAGSGRRVFITPLVVIGNTKQTDPIKILDVKFLLE